MAIFIDRHDMKGTNAAEVAAAHLKDLEIQDHYGVKFLTYWFDYDRGTAFCLVEAPDKDLVARVHREAHGGVPHEIIPADLSTVEAFLGRIQDPKLQPGSKRVEMDSAYRAVMFTDIVGSTEMTARLGDTMAVEIVRAHDSLVRTALARHGGREVKHTGDGIMAAFESVPAAVDCAGTVQRSFADYNARNRELIQVRVGIHAGEPIEDSGDLFGSTVQLAARICESAGPSEILVSEEVRRDCDAVEGFIDRGRKQFKGFAQPSRVFELSWC